MLEKLLGAWSFSTIMSHFAHHQVFFPTFLGVRPSFNGPTYYPHLLRMLSFDCSYINLSFLTRGAPYFSWCGGTCRDQYLPFPSNTMKYPCNVTWGRSITCLAFRNSKWCNFILKCNLLWWTNYMNRNLLCLYIPNR